MSATVRCEPMPDGQCYVGILPCGCCVAAAVIDGQSKREVSKSVAEWVKRGYKIETHSTEWTRQNLRVCKCGRGPEPMELQL